MTGVRWLDRVLAAAALVTLAPVLGVIAVAIRLTSPGPALHRATRAGLGGRPFTLYKFRSMVVGADASGPKVTAAGDTRVTPVGRMIRASKLDELPQLANVVKGEMALVGPRPEDPAYVDLADDMQAELYRHPPGITGPASLAFTDEERILAEAVAAGEPHEEAYRRIARVKMELDVAYLRRRSVAGDLAIAARTIGRALHGPGTPVALPLHGGAGADASRADHRAAIDATYRSYTGDYSGSRWGTSVPGNAAIVAEREQVARRLVASIEHRSVDYVVDVGAGAGGSFPELFPEAEHLRIDILPWRLEEGRSRGMSGAALCADGAALPLARASVDAALLSTVLSSIDRELGRRVLGEVRRVLRPDGVVVVYDLRVPNPRNRSTRAVSHRWLLEELAGFELRSRSLTVLPPLARGVARSERPYRFLARVGPLRTHNLVVGRRCAS